jgi:hypothetical protein
MISHALLSPRAVCVCVCARTRACAHVAKFSAFFRYWRKSACLRVTSIYRWNYSRSSVWVWTSNINYRSNFPHSADTGEKMWVQWESASAIHRLQECPLFSRREVLYNILTESGVSMKLFSLIKWCLNEMFSKVHVGKHLSDKQMQRKLSCCLITRMQGKIRK